MKQDKHDMKPAVSARRRLIRGAFAAPAAMTLFSGSVAAASINCVARQVTSQQLPTPSSGADSFIRVRLQKFTRRTNSDQTLSSTRWSRWILGSDVAGLKAPNGGSYISGTTWQLFDVGTQSIYPANAVGSTQTNTPSEDTDAGNEYSSVPAPSDYVALRMDANGNIVGVVGIGPNTGTTAVYASCWNSFRAGGP